MRSLRARSWPSVASHALVSRGLHQAGRTWGRLLQLIDVSVSRRSPPPTGEHVRAEAVMTNVLLGSTPLRCPAPYPLEARTLRRGRSVSSAILFRLSLQRNNAASHHRRRQMRELLVDFITSLDGCASGEGWPGWWGLQGPEYLAWLDEQPEVTYLMGANTYRLMAGFAAGDLPRGRRSSPPRRRIPSAASPAPRR